MREIVLFKEDIKKLIEETPSPVLTDENGKEDLLEKTVKMVEKIGYEEQVQLSLFMKMGNFTF